MQARPRFGQILVLTFKHLHFLCQASQSRVGCAVCAHRYFVIQAFKHTRIAHPDSVDDLCLERWVINLPLGFLDFLTACLHQLPQTQGKLTPEIGYLALRNTEDVIKLLSYSTHSTLNRGNDRLRVLPHRTRKQPVNLHNTLAHLFGQCRVCLNLFGYGRTAFRCKKGIQL